MRSKGALVEKNFIQMRGEVVTRSRAAKVRTYTKENIFVFKRDFIISQDWFRSFVL